MGFFCSANAQRFQMTRHQVPICHFGVKSASFGMRRTRVCMECCAMVQNTRCDVVRTRSQLTLNWGVTWVVLPPYCSPKQSPKGSRSPMARIREHSFSASSSHSVFSCCWKNLSNRVRPGKRNSIEWKGGAAWRTRQEGPSIFSTIRNLLRESTEAVLPSDL